MTQNEIKTKICDACRKETHSGEIKTLVLRTCCSVQQIPLCRECYAKSSGKK